MCKRLHAVSRNLRQPRRTLRRLKGASLNLYSTSSVLAQLARVINYIEKLLLPGRMNRKKASAEEQEVEDNEEQELEDAMIAARAVAAVRQAEEMAAEPVVRTHTKFDDEGNVVTTYEEQVYDSDGVLRGASASEEEDDSIGEEMMATIMDAAAAMESIEFTSGDSESPVAMQRDITATEWRGTHTRFDDEDEVEEMVVGRNKNATTSGKSKGECSD